MRGVVLLLAAGAGSRLDGGVHKAFVDLCGRPILRRAADAACAAELVESVVAAVPAGLEERARELLAGAGKPEVCVAGGATRQASAAAALEAAPPARAVAVHDAARALCPPPLFDVCLRALDTYEAVCPVMPASETVKEVVDGAVARTLDRSRLVTAQTPQAFRMDVYRRAHGSAARQGFEGTDDAALVELAGVPVHVVEGDARNIKITTRHDLVVAAALLGS